MNASGDAIATPKPTSLLAVTNRHSRALVPSAIYADGMEERGLKQGNHIYLIAVGPRVNVISAAKNHAGWRVETEYFESGWKPRTLHIPLNLFPSGEIYVEEGALVHVDGAVERRHTAAELARMILERSRNDDSLRARTWEQQTVNKFFRYSVAYVGQAYGRKVRRSAFKRLRDGHEHLQKVLAHINDHHRNSDVGIIMMDAHVRGREMSAAVDSTNAAQLGEIAAAMLANPEGTLVDEALLIDAAEAMLIRYFQPTDNDSLKEFPVKDRPGLVKPLLDEGITHLAIQIDLSISFVLLKDPTTGESKHRHSFSVNLASGKEEVASVAPLAWRPILTRD